jgi:predicted membrane-bound mannosyltransferase
VEWLLRIEPAVLLPGLAGVVLALLRAERHATVFLALWACGMLSAYSIIPYKTPWLALNIIVPLAACAGYAAQAAWHRWSAAVWYCTCALALGISVALCVSLNFYRYDDHEMPYVYVHAPRGLHDMLKAIERYGEAQGSGRNTRIAVVSPENWPLPWYLRNHPYASFPGKLSFDDNPRVLIARADQVAAIRARPDKWRELGVCALRPGVQLHVFVR